MVTSDIDFKTLRKLDEGDDSSVYVSSDNKIIKKYKRHICLWIIREYHGIHEELSQDIFEWDLPKKLRWEKREDWYYQWWLFSTVVTEILNLGNTITLSGKNKRVTTVVPYIEGENILNCLASNSFNSIDAVMYADLMAHRHCEHKNLNISSPDNKSWFNLTQENIKVAWVKDWKLHVIITDLWSRIWDIVTMKKTGNLYI
jgi:hypothetical protein